MLKTLERLVDRYIRDGPLIVKPLHTRQHAYQTGKSVDTALIEAVGYMQACMNNRGMLLAAMLGMDGAFNHTSSTSIMRGMKQQEVLSTLSRWVGNMLSTRSIEISWGLVQKTASVRKGCPQGGVMSPTAWCLIIDELLRELDETEIHSDPLQSTTCLA